MYDYREYCPVAKGAQLLCERWTVLIVRELLMGATRFNQLRRFLPRISPTLLKSRLSMLEDEGIVVRVRTRERDGFMYQLTSAGQELLPVVAELGHWAARWQYDKFKDDEVNVDAMMRDLEFTLKPAQMPGPRTILRIIFEGEPDDAHWHVVVDGDHVDACDEDRGLEVDVYLCATPRAFADILLGKLSLQQALTETSLKATGSGPHIESIARWFGLSPHAEATHEA